MNAIIFNGKEESRSLGNLPEINDANYYDDKLYLTNSMMGMLKTSPIDLAEYIKGNKKQSKALTMGDALDKLLLEPHIAETYIRIWSQRDLPIPEQTLRTKVNKEWLDNFYQENIGKCILKDNEYQEIVNMRDSLMNKPTVRKIIEGAKTQMIALKEINGVPCKSKCDLLEDDEFVSDIKTTEDISKEEFLYSCQEYGYFRQGGMYTEMFGKKRFRLIVVEKKAPYKVAIYTFSPERLEQGKKELMELTDKYKYYFANPFENKTDQYIIEETI